LHPNKYKAFSADDFIDTIDSTAMPSFDMDILVVDAEMQILQTTIHNKNAIEIRIALFVFAHNAIVKVAHVVNINILFIP